MIYVIFLSCLYFVLLYCNPVQADNEPAVSPVLRSTRCEMIKPHPGITAADLMKIKYRVKYTKYARDYQGMGTFKLIPPNNLVRSRYWKRYRIILDEGSKGIDYKDLLVILGPQSIKGTSVLTWTYADADKEQDVWVWLPSLRKVRRMSPSEAADSLMGSDMTVEDVATRKWEDERYAMVGERKHAGHSCEYHEEIFHTNRRCYVIEARPVRETWYYSKRIVWLDSQFGGLICDEIFDPAGKKWRTIIKEYEVFDDGCIAQVFIEAADLLNRHKSIIGFKKGDILFNSGLHEGFFSEKTLMRTKW